MSSFNGKITVITGAASGIGRELALQMSREGAVIVAADYNKKSLAETVKIIKNAGGQAAGFPLDISDIKQVTKFAADVKKRYRSIDILVNNAGVALFGKIDELSIKNFEWIVNINLWGAIYMTKAFLPEIKEKQDSYLVNVSSIFGVVGVGSQSAYCTTKFGLRGFTEALQHELSDFPVNIVSVIPGGIKTDIAKNARYIEDGAVNKNIEEHVRKFDNISKTTAAEAAEVIIKGMKNKKSRIRIGSDAKFLDRLQRLMPVKYSRVIAKLFR